MSATISASQGYTFADGNTGHACVFTAGAPLSGDYDLIYVNSDTVVATPTGFTATISSVGGQGAYAFTRLSNGSQTDTVTITTSGNFNAAVDWIRVHGATLIDTPNGVAFTAVDGSNGTSTPAVTTGTLSTATDLVTVAALLHSASSSAPVTPVWSAGYTAVDTVSLGTGGNCVTQFTAVKVPAGTAAESPSVSWTNAIGDRYVFVVAFTASASLVGTATDAFTTADAATRALVQARAATDAFATADATTSTAAHPRAGTDAFTTVDSPTRSAAHPRAVADAVGMVDAVTSVVTLARSVTDAAGVVDVATRTATHPRTVTDSIAVTDVATGTSPPRTLTLIFGQTQFMWSFGTPRTSSGITVGGGPVILSVLATDYVQVAAAAFVNGSAIDPSNDLVEMAFTTVGARPGSGDWHTGSWTTAPGGTFLAQRLVGPGAGGVALGLGIYGWWVRITDNPTIPVAEVGQLQIV